MLDVGCGMSDAGLWVARGVWGGLPGSRELLEEAHIVFEEHADVVDAVLQHCLAFYAHTEGKARVLTRVDATVFEYGRIYHTTA